MVTSADMRISVWSADWSSDMCELVDWLTFPTPAYTQEGNKIKHKNQVNMKNIIKLLLR